MVVSYRRAADETRADRRILALLASSARIPAALLHSASVDSDSDSPMRSFDSTSVLLQHARFADDAEKQERVQQHDTTPSTLHDDEIHIASSRDRAAQMWQEKKLWESAHPGTLMQTKHLAILFCVLTHAEAARFAPYLEHWSERFAYDWSEEHHTEQYSQQQRYHPYASSASSFSGASSTVGSPRRIALIQQIQQIQQRVGAGPRSGSGVSWAFLPGLGSSGQSFTSSSEDEAWQPASQLSSLIQICADVAGWLVFSADNVGRFQQLFTDCVPLLLEKDALRSKFVEFVQLVCSLIDRFLSTSRATHPQQSVYASTQALVEDLIAAVFKFDALQTIRPAVLTILSSTSMHGLAAFVAQARSHFLRESGSSPNSTSSGSTGGAGVDTRFNGMALTRVLHSVVSPFRGSWRFETAQSVAEPSPFGGDHVIGVINALDWMRECSVVEIGAEGGQQLVVRSLWSINDGDANASLGTTLVADGRARVFSHFPSGLSSMIPLGARYYGDYEANFLAPDLLELELYAWSDIDSVQTVNERESSVPQWGSDENTNNHPGVLRWRLQLALERFGRPTAAPGTPVLRVDVAVDLGHFQDTDDTMEHGNLHERLSEVAGWQSLQRLQATYQRVRE